ncbi:MFS transporter [Spirochaeta isovalerica]|uniref:MFS family permease n=1 Tax=Spirochaeta isovalerica TaxID=150 RepID=A0A841RI87_9SPIO|nr:MFS transporter [Spirochaeta isovalerica]MBB6482469.1 MFS family permease [Spirochaeta isovalerica]
MKNTTNPNLRIFNLFTLIQAFGRGIWMGNVLSLYIVLLSEKSTGILGLTPNELLGITSAITGIALILTIIPGGYAADKWSREKALVLAAMVGTGGLLFIGFSTSLYHIMAGLFLWGVFQGLSQPSAESILANSLPSGERSGPYARIHMLRQFGLATGPVLNVILFLILGDKWELGILKTVMTAGLAVSLISIIIMIFLKDRHEMGDRSEGILAEETDNEKAGGFSLKSRKAVPLILISSSFIIGTGAGMTVKFFPVFFRDIYGLKPIAVQIILGISFFITGLISIYTQKHSIKKGRPQMIILVQGLSIACLAGMAFYPPLWLLIPLFIARGALMNASQPLNRSIMMDFVPKSRRGFWNSLQTVAWGLFWNASAAIGGFLIGENNYALCFFITAIVYVIGTLPNFFLIPLVKKEL